MIAVREFKSAAEMLAYANNNHRKFYAKPPLKVIPPVVEAKIECPIPRKRRVITDTRPLWRKEEIHFDAHIRDHQWYRAQVGSMKIGGYVRRRCMDLGIDHDLMCSHRRTRSIVAARQLLMWEVRQKFKISYPEIGRLFGGRDHSTCVWAIRRVEAKMAGKEITKRAKK